MPYSGPGRRRPNSEIISQQDSKAVNAHIRRAHTPRLGWQLLSVIRHIVPNFQTLVDDGLAGIIENSDKRAAKVRRPKKIVLHLRKQFLQGRASLPHQLGRNRALGRLVSNRPTSFHNAVQLVFSFHAYLHLVSELTAFGRIDQILEQNLEQNLEQGGIMLDRAQKISHSIASINGLGGNFPQGGSINQSVQQDIIRGYKPTEGETPEGGANPVTLLCRKAAAASPSTCPVPRPGGSSHPVLYNDSKLCNDLFWSRKTITRALSRH
ncbi:hypothetical protein F4825DRAFT_447829 [Nemania diffusa]|nr:hypothetical protein F4825DRAFT_447829 [Nemania diffusa]